MEEATFESTELMATSASPESSDVKVIFRVQYGFLAPLIMLLTSTVLANALVIMCVYTDKKLHKPNNLYVVTLAGVDAVVGLVVMSGMTVYTLYGLWPLGDALCTLWVAADFSCCSISIFHLCLIAYDRYQALTKPHMYKRAHRMRSVIFRIVSAFTLGGLVWIPAVIIFRVQQEPVKYDCLFVPNKEYILVQAILVYYLPLVGMVYFYGGCLRGLQMQYKKINDIDGAGRGVMVLSSVEASFTGTATTLAPPDGSIQPTAVSVNNSITNSEVATITNQTEGHGSNAVEKKHIRRRHQHMRSIRTLGVIIVIFLFCWLPFIIFWPITAFCGDCINARLYEYSYWAAYINSAVNPLLYFLCNKDFRVAFIKLVRRPRIVPSM